MNDLSIRSATRADLPGLAGIVLEWERRTAWMHSAYTAQEIAGFLSDAFNDRLILISGYPAIAYLAFNPKRQRIGGLYSNVRGKGVGKALIDAIKEGRTYLWLNTHKPNLAAQKFYKREGFVEVPNEGVEPSNIVPELRMEWRV